MEALLRGELTVMTLPNWISRIIKRMKTIFCKGDIATLESSEFDWADDKRLASLEITMRQVRDKINKAIVWYQRGRATKRTIGAGARYLAIVLGLIAAAIPTVTQIALTSGSTVQDWWQNPGMATIVGLFAGGLLLVDRFAGGTSSWVRYTMAETALKELLDDLTFAWPLEAGKWADRSKPTVEETKQSLGVLKGFGDRLNQIIRNETELWKSEFQSALQQTDEWVKAQPKKSEEGLVTVKIANPDRLAGKWSVSLNGGPEHEGVGDTKVLHVAVGAVTVRVRAEIKTGPDGTQTKEYTVEAGEIIPAATNKTISITLPMN